MVGGFGGDVPSARGCPSTGQPAFTRRGAGQSAGGVEFRREESRVEPAGHHPTESMGAAPGCPAGEGDETGDERHSHGGEFAGPKFSTARTSIVLARAQAALSRILRWRNRKRSTAVCIYWSGSAAFAGKPLRAWAVGMRCRASHFSVTRVSARDETIVVTHRGRNIAVLVPVEVWAARQRRPTGMAGFFRIPENSDIASGGFWCPNSDPQ